MTEQETEVELVTFSSNKEAYVYAPLPAATSYGHRAELWNPDKWLKEVKVKVVTAGDNCYVRMLDNENGELFAECPLPHDGIPITTAVEPVVDSSRYFVVKVVDRESGNHAFVGIGFRERMDASDFSAALDDYRQYLRRKQEAEQMREQFSKQTLTTDGEAAQEGTAAAAAAAAAADLSLKPGQTIRINLSSSLKRSSSSKVDSSKASPAAAGSSSSSSAGSPQLKLAPPPSSSSSSSSSGFFKLQPPLVARSVSGSAAAVGVQQITGSSSSSSSSSSKSHLEPASTTSSPQVMRVSDADAAAVPVVAASSREDDDWGDFVS